MVISHFTKLASMYPEYEYYGTYDENASGEINLEGQIRDWLQTMELMFNYIESMKPEILEEFLDNLLIEQKVP